MRTPNLDTGSVLGDIESILLPVFALHDDYTRGTVLANKSMMAEALAAHDFLQAYGELHRTWRQPLIHALDRGKAYGELRADADSAALVDMMPRGVVVSADAGTCAAVRAACLADRQDRGGG